VNFSLVHSAILSLVAGVQSLKHFLLSLAMVKCKKITEEPKIVLQQLVNCHACFELLMQAMKATENNAHCAFICCQAVVVCVDCASNFR